MGKIDSFMINKITAFRYAITLVLIFSISHGYSQRDSVYNFNPYKVHKKIEVPIVAVGEVFYLFQSKKLDAYSSLDPSEVSNYKKGGVNNIDSKVFRISESGYDQAGKTSDYVFIGSVVAPALLLLDKNIRSNWADFITLYAEAQFTQSMIYLGTNYSVRRARPFVYNSNLSSEERAGINATNSFFSGHTSTTAAATFFMAKVYSDYHELSTLNNIYIYMCSTSCCGSWLSSNKSWEAFPYRCIDGITCWSVIGNTYS